MILCFVIQNALFLPAIQFSMISLTVNQFSKLAIRPRRIIFWLYPKNKNRLQSGKNKPTRFIITVF